MALTIRRDANSEIRQHLTFEQRWEGEDRGLIISWEQGRKLAIQNPELSNRAKDGELVELPWKRGSWFYLAMWQGLKGEDLIIDTSRQIIMTRTYNDANGEEKSQEIKFPESGTCPEHLKKLKAEGRIRDLYSD